eukprot:4610057-Amphidinium_carterae.2
MAGLRKSSNLARCHSRVVFFTMRLQALDIGTTYVELDQDIASDMQRCNAVFTSRGTSHVVVSVHQLEWSPLSGGTGQQL